MDLEQKPMAVDASVMPSQPSTLPTTGHPLDSKFNYLSISYHASVPHVTVVALNRPEKRNAINAEMWNEIGQSFREIGTVGDGCRCILLLGNGKGFCGGIDVTDNRFFSGIASSGEEGNDSSPDFARRSLAFRSQILQMQAAFTAVEESPVPVVAAIHGACVGAGFDLACCADVRISSSDAKFSIREVRLGLAADVGTLQRFPRIVGFGSRLRELCLTGDDFNANDALEIGFVSRVTETKEDLIDAASDICRRISRNSPVAVAVTKLSLNYSRDHSVAESLQHIALHNSSALMTDDLAQSFMNMGGTSAVQFAPLAPHSRL